MALATIYVKATGEVLRVVNCPSDMMHLQVQEGEAKIDNVEGYAGVHYVENGVLKEKTPPQ